MKTTINYIRISLFIYLITLFLLGLRPKSEYLYQNFFPGFEFGGWHMYRYYLDQEINCYFISSKNDTIEIDWDQHLYHSKFASRAHPDFYSPSADEFLIFLKKNNPKIKEIKKSKIKGSLFLSINSFIEKRDTLSYVKSIDIF